MNFSFKYNWDANYNYNIMSISYDIICNLNPSKEAKYNVFSIVETIHFFIHIDGSIYASRLHSKLPHHPT